jgi:hypothetical protein
MINTKDEIIISVSVREVPRIGNRAIVQGVVSSESIFFPCLTLETRRVHSSDTKSDISFKTYNNATNWDTPHHACVFKCRRYNTK